MDPAAFRAALLAGAAEEGVTVMGNVELLDVPVSHLPRGLVVDGNLTLRDCPISDLPAGLTVTGALSLWSCPRFFEIGSDIGDIRFVSVRHCPLGKIAPDLTFAEGLELVDTHLAVLPPVQVLEGDIDLSQSAFLRALPAGLHTPEDLILTGAALPELPMGLHVGGMLHLDGTCLERLPDDLEVEKGIVFGSAPVAELTRLNGRSVNSASEAAPFLRAIADRLQAGGTLDMSEVHSDCGTAHCIAGWAQVLFPAQVRREHELVDAINLLGLDAARHFHVDTATARRFLDGFAGGAPSA